MGDCQKILSVRPGLAAEQKVKRTVITSIERLTNSATAKTYFIISNYYCYVTELSLQIALMLAMFSSFSDAYRHIEEGKPEMSSC